MAFRFDHVSDQINFGTYQWSFLNLPFLEWPFTRRPYNVSPHEIKTHMHVIGKSGSGKSNFLAALFLAMFDAGMGATLIDPHGDLAKLIMAHLVAQGVFDRRDGYNRVIYLDLPGAERRGRYMPFNVLSQAGESDVVASNIRDAFHRAWPELATGAPAFDTLIHDTITLLVHNGYPITAAYRLLTNTGFRNRLLTSEQDQDLVDAFHDVYDQLKKTDQLDYAGSLLRRTRQLTQLQVLRYGLGQREMLLDFRRLMDTNKTIIINLALHNPDARRLLGCFLTVAAEQAALSRSALSPAERIFSHHLFIDECQLFMAQSEDSFSTILSQARKYGLGLILAHQNWSQIPDALRGTLQNVGYEVAFKQGRDDAERSAKIVGEVNPLEVKHQVEDLHAQERTHPTFASIAEQWERWVQRMQRLGRGEAFVKSPSDRVTRIQTRHVRYPELLERRLAEVEAWYLRYCYRRRDEVEAELAELRQGDPDGDKSGVVRFG